MTPAQQTQQRLAVNASWARTQNRTARTEPARQAAERRLAEKYDIPADLPPREYALRMQAARRRNAAARTAGGEAA